MLMDTDILILFGRCSDFTRTARLLCSNLTRRPGTVLWHTEPLPPQIIPERAFTTALMLSLCDWGRLPRPLSALVRFAPGHNAVRDLARFALSKRLKRLTGWDTVEAWRNVHSRQWFHAVEHYVWLRQWHSHRWCDLVATGTRSRCEVLERLGIHCEYAPVGYHPAWGRDLVVERDIDVLFLGRVKRTSRQSLLHRIEAELRQRGVTLTVVDRDCYGMDRTQLVSRTRIALDLVKDPWDMPTQRLLISMACGALVISNWGADPFPFGEEHLVRADPDSIAATISYYLRHESERRSVAETARRHVTRRLMWRTWVDSVLRRCLAQREGRNGVGV